MASRVGWPSHLSTIPRALYRWVIPSSSGTMSSSSSKLLSYVPYLALLLNFLGRGGFPSSSFGGSPSDELLKGLHTHVLFEDARGHDCKDIPLATKVQPLAGSKDFCACFHTLHPTLCICVCVCVCMSVSISFSLRLSVLLRCVRETQHRRT
jgi:hypothetical protein